jgi:hypothetical protein
MVMLRLNDGKVNTHRAALENRCHRYARSSTSDDENLMVC